MSETGPRILVVDDEPAVRRFLSRLLPAYGYMVFEAGTGQDALSAVVAHKPDLVVLDLGLPDLDGVQVTRLLREWTRIPIVILSVRGDEEDKVAALDAGADDYLTKPFGSRELMARLRAALRRGAQVAGEPVFVEGDLRVDLARRELAVSGCPIQLSPNEYELLRILVMNAGKVVTHRQLLREVRGSGSEEGMHLLRVNVSNLRRKLEPDPTRPRFIVTEPGVGYRLRVDSEETKRQKEQEQKPGASE